MNSLRSRFLNCYIRKTDIRCFFKRNELLSAAFMSSRPSFAGQESTIFALATGGLPSAVAIVRVSGKSASKVLQLVGRFPAGKLPAPRKATVKKLYDITKGSIIDQALILWFPGPKSYTGEDCCEFHIHGGPSVVQGLLGTISTVEDCRMAEAGEFTRRAFLNGKMDLTEVDGLGDLMTAETEMQRIQALNQMEGSLGKIYHTWRDTISKCLADVEAYIDFGDEENIEAEILNRVESRLDALLGDIKRHLRDSRKGERLRHGVSVAIVGKPNAGKSSLLNLLCQREAAIVSEIPGTTRDVVEAIISISGYPVVLADTAGIRSESEDQIEIEGIRRALREAKRADIIILLVDLSDKNSQPGVHAENIDKKKLLSEGILFRPAENSLNDIPVEKIMLVGNKVDLDVGKQAANSITTAGILDAALSCKTLQGYDEFLKHLSDRVSKLCANPKSESPYITRERYRSHLANCVHHLEEYLQWSKLVTSGDVHVTVDFALGTVPLKSAINSIGYITGHVGTEDILDIIFRDFCIGK